MMEKVSIFLGYYEGRVINVELTKRELHAGCF